MADGEGCTCFASHQGECACDADWTPKEVIELRAELQLAKDGYADFKGAFVLAENEITTLRQQLVIAIEALEKYAEGRVFDQDVSDFAVETLNKIRSK